MWLQVKYWSLLVGFVWRKYRGAKNLFNYYFFIIPALLQHVTHELMHVFVAKKQGLVVTKIQWFTYYGGTKVFIEGEDAVVNGEAPVTKAWVYMNAAEIFGTTLLAYVFCGIYLVAADGIFKLFLWELDYLPILMNP